jgi:uncharacterized repeat protein (TIGR01451 family)
MIRRLAIFLTMSLLAAGGSLAQSGAIGVWPLNGNANDASGNHLHGTVSGALPTGDRHGNPGAAFLFNGSSDHITLPETSDPLAFIQNTGVFTIAAFIKVNNLDARSTILGTSITSLNKGFLFWYENRDANTRKLAFQRSNGTHMVYDIVYGAKQTINDNEWHHVAVVGDGSSIRFYVDGQQDGLASALRYPSSGSSTWRGLIGATPDASGKPAMHFNGGLDELHVYNRSLSQEEIQALMASGDTPGLHAVKGKIFYDKNQNGTYDQGDEPLSGIYAKTDKNNAYAISDQQGDYVLYLEKGDYSLQQVLPNYTSKYIIPTSPQAAYELSLGTTASEQSGFDFGNDVKQVPVLSIDVNSTRFRRCFTNTTLVQYCNEGFAAASGVEVVLEYPEYVVPIASSIPWTRDGNRYTFTIGTLEAKSCRILTLTDSVICGDESIRGLTQCIQASISPRNSDLNTHPDWDGSDIVLTAECRDNSFVRLKIENQGAGDMADSAAFTIFLVQAQVYSGKYKLAANESLSLNLLAHGKPLHLEAVLTPHHPEKRKVSISMQGCTSGNDGVIRHGFEAQFSQNDESETFESACLPIVDSYDPNDKLVMPAGVTENNNVEEDALLEYTIRFQNTGTDVAYTVVIEDPLSEHLDLSTLRVGISSHPVSWTLANEESPTLVWRFNNINLPDSTTNEKDSHGFVKFQIRPKPEAGRGTIIRNHASIFFDYNSAIVTNEVSNTLGMPEMVAGDQLLVQNCNTVLSLEAEEDQLISLCGEEQFMLSRTAGAGGWGMWKVTKGSASLADPFSSQTLASNLSVGENEFAWTLSWCDQQVVSTTTLIRQEPLEKPLVPASLALCEGGPVTGITASGEGIEWYADASLSQLLASGNTYSPSGQGASSLYVIRRRGECTSDAALVEVEVYAKPLPPLSNPYQESCTDLAPPRLSAEGSSIRWYADAEGQQLLAEGNSFTPSHHGSARYYVTQSTPYCESQPTEVSFTAKQYDPDKAFIANVITPNEDDTQNRYFYLKPFETQECLGDFRSIRIFNRWGRTVFESRQADFRWDASQLPTGVYYYRMDWAQQKFQGTLQVIR